MMKALRRLLLMVSLLMMVICVVLLLNFTAPNPTGRRYSSSVPLVSDGSLSSSKLAGDSGEIILSNDLRLPRNTVDGRGESCLCSTSYQTTGSTSRCNTCFRYSDQVTIGDFSIPDFISDRVIADSKNAKTLTSDDKSQIQTYLIYAHEMQVPLWLYVRMDTRIERNYQYLLPEIRETGGDIIPYFTYEGYIDPIDQTAGIVGYIALVSSALLLMIEFRRTNQGNYPISKPPSDKADDAESYARRMRDKLQNRIDVEDSRNHS